LPFSSFVSSRFKQAQLANPGQLLDDHPDNSLEDAVQAERVEIEGDLVNATLAYSGW
jgi:hypothetical protein